MIHKRARVPRPARLPVSARAGDPISSIPRESRPTIASSRSDTAISPRRTFFHQALAASAGMMLGASRPVSASISLAALAEPGSLANHWTAMDASTTVGGRRPRRLPPRRRLVNDPGPCESGLPPASDEVSGGPGSLPPVLRPRCGSSPYSQQGSVELLARSTRP